MSRHKANASPDYHAGMALHYLYHATRSLAGASGQLDAFKAWDKELTIPGRDAMEDYLTALSSWHAFKKFPWGPVTEGSRAQDQAQAAMAERAKQRPANFEDLSPEERWAIDKDLGILDWEGGL